MAKIIAPNKQYAGISAGVLFVNGEGETDNEYLMNWFERKGYRVEREELANEQNQNEDTLEEDSQEPLERKFLEEDSTENNVEKIPQEVSKSKNRKKGK